MFELFIECSFIKSVQFIEGRQIVYSRSLRHRSGECDQLRPSPQLSFGPKTCRLLLFDFLKSMTTLWEFAGGCSAMALILFSTPNEAVRCEDIFE